MKNLTDVLSRPDKWLQGELYRPHIPFGFPKGVTAACLMGAICVLEGYQEVMDEMKSLRIKIMAEVIIDSYPDFDAEQELYPTIKFAEPRERLKPDCWLNQNKIIVAFNNATCRTFDEIYLVCKETDRRVQFQQVGGLSK